MTVRKEPGTVSAGRPKWTQTEMLLQAILDELRYLNAERRAQQKYRQQRFQLFHDGATAVNSYHARNAEGTA